MSKKPPTEQQVYLIAGTASVSLPTVRKFFRGNEPMRPAMLLRITEALKTLELTHLHPGVKK